MNSRDEQNSTGRGRQDKRRRATGIPEERPASLERFLSVADVADLLGVCERTVRRWIDFKELAEHAFGSITRIGERDLRAFIAAARRGPPASHDSDLLDDEFYTAGYVAELLGVCVKTVRRRLKSKVLAEHSFGGIVRIARSDFQDFVSRSRRD